MDSIQLTAGKTQEGLDSMLEAVLGPHGYIQPWVEIPVALLIVAIAKRAEDKPAWFPCGKWATIQAIEQSVALELDKLADKHARRKTNDMQG